MHLKLMHIWALWTRRSEAESPRPTATKLSKNQSNDSLATESGIKLVRLGRTDVKWNIEQSVALINEFLEFSSEFSITTFLTP